MSHYYIYQWVFGHIYLSIYVHQHTLFFVILKFRLKNAILSIFFASFFFLQCNNDGGAVNGSIMRCIAPKVWAIFQHTHFHIYFMLLTGRARMWSHSFCVNWADLIHRCWLDTMIRTFQRSVLANRVKNGSRNEHRSNWRMSRPIIAPTM